jgi:hypothetical protein
MNNYVSIHGLCICAAIFIISGCSITSHYGADPPDWDYKCPDFVSQEDNEYCHDHAYDAASNVMRETASDGFSNTAILLGPFGVLGGAAYISEKEDWVYEEAFKECLRERGYDIR